MNISTHSQTIIRPLQNRIPGSAVQVRREELQDRFDQVEDKASIQALMLRDMAQRSPTPAVVEKLLEQALRVAHQAALTVPQLASLALESAELGLRTDEVTNLQDGAHDSLQNRGALAGHPLAKTLKTMGNTKEQVSFLHGLAQPDLPLEALAQNIAKASGRYHDGTDPVQMEMTRDIFSQNKAYAAESALLEDAKEPWYNFWEKGDLHPLALLEDGPAQNLSELAQKAARSVGNGNTGKRVLNHFKKLDLNEVDRKIVSLLEDVPESSYTVHRSVTQPYGLPHLGRHTEYNDSTVVEILSDIKRCQNGNFRSDALEQYAASQVQDPQFKAALAAAEKVAVRGIYPSSMSADEAWTAIKDTKTGEDPVVNLATASSRRAVTLVKNLMNGQSVKAPRGSTQCDRNAIALELLANDAADPKVREAAFTLTQQLWTSGPIF